MQDIQLLLKKVVHSRHKTDRSLQDMPSSSNLQLAWLRQWKKSSEKMCDTSSKGNRSLKVCPGRKRVNKILSTCHLSRMALCMLFSISKLHRIRTCWQNANAVSHCWDYSPEIGIKGDGKKLKRGYEHVECRVETFSPQNIYSGLYVLQVIIIIIILRMWLERESRHKW